MASARRPVVVVLVALVVAAGAVVIGAPAASAHAQLVSVTPADGSVLDTQPPSVVLEFNEAVQPNADETTLMMADRTPIPVTVSEGGARIEITIDPSLTLADGTYVLGWVVRSADSHRIAGALQFHIGAPSPGVVTDDLIATLSEGSTVPLTARVAWYSAALAAVVAFGAVVVGWLMSRGPSAPTASDSKVPPTGALPALAAVGSLAAVTSGLFVAISMGDSATWWQFGVLLLGGVLVSFGALWAPGVVPLVGSVVLVGAFALSGHSRTATPVWMSTASDVVHLVAAGVWGGGIIAMLVALRSLVGQPGRRADLVARFSLVAGGALAAISVTGTLLAWRIRGSWGDVFEGEYGRLLLMKLAAVVVIVALGAFNRFRLVGRVDDEQTAGLLRRTMLGEAVVIVVVIGITAVMSTTPPVTAAASASGGSAPVVDGSAVPGRLVDRAEFGAAEATFTLTPTGASAGGYELVITLLDAMGAPVELADDISVGLRQRDAGIGPIRPQLVNAEPGVWRGEVTLVPSGTWEINAAGVVSDFEQPQAIVTVDVP